MYMYELYTKIEISGILKYNTMVLYNSNKYNGLYVYTNKRF